MGVRKTVSPSDAIVFEGRISFGDNSAFYKILGRSELVDENYNNFVFITNNNEYRRKVMFGSKYKITIEHIDSKEHYMLDTIDGANVPNNNEQSFVSFKFVKIWNESITSTETQTFTIIVPTNSILVKKFGLGEPAKISIEVDSEREDYAE